MNSWIIIISSQQIQILNFIKEIILLTIFQFVPFQNIFFYLEIWNQYN